MLWPAANMVLNARELGLSPESLHDVSYRTVLRIDRIAAAWQHLSRPTSNDNVRIATQNDIRSMLQ